MNKEVIYVTRYSSITKLKHEVIREYSEKCVVCRSREDVIITPILPTEYAELSRETWNNIPLCKYCNRKLKDYNRKNSNGIKNLLQLVRNEYKKK